MNLRLASRYLPIVLVAGAFVASLLSLRNSGGWFVPVVVFGVLTALGVADLLQSHSTLRRIYPLIGSLRYLLESIGPEFRQYFIESDSDAVPFSREQRAVVYQRAKNTLDKRPFGTLHDVYAPDYEWMSPSFAPVAVPNHDFRSDDRRRACAAVLGQRLQHFGDELRRDLAECDPRAERRREARWLLPRHRRGFGLAVSP